MNPTLKRPKIRPVLLALLVLPFLGSCYHLGWHWRQHGHHHHGHHGHVVVRHCR